MAFDESKHPRAEDGKFTSKDGAGASTGGKEATPKKKIDYENIKYPKGTSKEYTMSVNKKYEDSLPILAKYGIKLEDFGGKDSEFGGYEDNTKEIMDKYVFNPFREKNPYGNNKDWEENYQAIFDAIDAVLDKNYNDWWIEKHSDEEQYDKTDEMQPKVEIDADYERAYGEAPDPEEFPSQYQKYIDEYKEWKKNGESAKDKDDERKKASKLFGLPF